MRFFSNRKQSLSNSASIDWQPMEWEEQIDRIMEASNQIPQLIFKHSTRCSISTMALQRLQNEWHPDTEIDAWFLDLLAYRNVSNAIADRLGVWHQSPQAILIKEGRVVYHDSHHSIHFSDILEAI